MSIQFDVMLQTFLAETEENLREMEEALVALESHPDDQETLQCIFRIAHTLKGNACVVGYTGLSQFAHKVEDVLDLLLKKKIANTTELTTLILQCADNMRFILAASTAGKTELDPAQQELVTRLERNSHPPAQAPQQPGAARGSGDRRKGSGRRQDDAPGNKPDSHVRSDHASTLRVGVEKLNRLLNVTGEIAIARGRLRQVLEELPGRSSEPALEAHSQSDQLYMELQELVLKIRMIPVGPMFRQFIRTVRDLATVQGKAAHLVLEGEDVEVDMSVLEHIRDPLMHMIRNAVDHGIEHPDVRARLGKASSGEIVLRAFYEAGNIVIQLADDGAGLNRSQIVERALARGLITDAQKLSDAEIYELIFEPGFSTSETVTEVSGRGIGMDVVRRNVDGLHGSTMIESHEGRGTTVTIHLPLTLAVINGLLVGVGKERYIVPLDSVVECLAMPLEEQQHTRCYGYIGLRGKALPYIRLRNIFSLQEADSSREQIVVVRHGSGLAGLAVDRLFGERQAVIKPLGKFFERAWGISGSTILSTGRVGLILDVPALLRKALEGSS